MPLKDSEPLKKNGPLNRVFGNNQIRRILLNFSFLFSATGLAVVLGVLQNILTGRLLGVTGIGLLATIIMFTSVVNKFASFRMSELVVKYVGQFTEQNEPQRAAVVFKIAALAELSVSVVAFILVILLSPLAAHWLAKDDSLAGWFRLYGLIILANIIAESSTGLLLIFNRHSRIAIYNAWSSVVTLLGIAFVSMLHIWLVPLVLQKQGLEGAGLDAVLSTYQIYWLPAIVVAYILGKVVGALGLTSAALREASQRWGRNWWQGSVRLLQPQARELVSFAVSTNLSATFSLINKDAEGLWISLFRSPTEVGYYKTALSFINLAQLPVTPLSQATYPELSRDVANQQWGNLRDVLRRGSLLAGGFALVIMVGLALLGRQLIMLLYRDPGFLPAYPAVLILIPGFFIAITFYWNRTALLALGRPDFPTKLNLILAFCKLIGIFLLVPRFGYLANAALLSGSYLVGVTISVFKTRSLLKLKNKNAEL